MRKSVRKRTKLFGALMLTAVTLGACSSDAVDANDLLLPLAESRDMIPKSASVLKEEIENYSVMPLGDTARFAWNSYDDNGELSTEYSCGTITYIAKREHQGKTYYEFGALGHRPSASVSEPFGLVYDVDVKGIGKNEEGRDRLIYEKKDAEPIGVVLAATDWGVVGILSKDADKTIPGLDFEQGEWMGVAKPRKGDAQLLSQTEEGAALYRDIVLRRIKENFAIVRGSGETLDFEYKSVGDWRSVPGMSGSAIVQNGKLVGIAAAANEDDGYRYGIFATDLLRIHDKSIEEAIATLRNPSQESAIYNRDSILDFLDKAAITEKESTRNQLASALKSYKPQQSIDIIK